MLAPEDAAALVGISTRALYRALEAGRIHFTEVQDGAQAAACLPRFGKQPDYGRA